MEDTLKNKELFHKDNAINDDDRVSEFELSKRKSAGVKHFLTEASDVLKRPGMTFIGSAAVFFWVERKTRIHKMAYDFDHAEYTDLSDVPEGLVVESFKSLKKKAKDVYGRK